MSRTGILPEADFYCPIPYEPLHIVTDQALNAEIQKGEEGLLDRVFRLIVEEIKFADPDWSQRIALESLNVDSFAQAWFAERKQRDPFDWAEKISRKSNAINEKTYCSLALCHSAPA